MPPYSPPGNKLITISISYTEKVSMLSSAFVISVSMLDAQLEPSMLFIDRKRADTVRVTAYWPSLSASLVVHILLLIVNK